MALKSITVRGAKHHNLKNIDVEIPRDKLVVITGVSGSGKSSLAFDTIYAEGQRRYVESLSSYARQFLGQMEKPKVDFIGGLSPAIAIEQKTVSKNPRSTVATVTEVMDYLRVLYANIGTPHCPNCGREVHAQSAEQIARQIAALPEGSKLQLLAPVVRNRKGTHVDVLKDAKAAGFVRARVNGDILPISEDIKLEKKNKHSIDIVVDRLVIPADAAVDDAFMSRLTESVETTLKTAEGLLLAAYEDKDILMSEHNACPHCDISFPELATQMFSFNSPLGMCETCHGLGTHMDVDIDLLVTDENLTLNKGALRYYGELGKKKGWTVSSVESIGRNYGFDLNTPWKDIPKKGRDALLYGSKGKKIEFVNRTARGYTRRRKKVLYGVVYNLKRGYHDANSDMAQDWYESFMRELPCEDCGGARLNPAARAVTVGDKGLSDFSKLSIGEAYEWITDLEKNATALELEIAGEVLKEIRDRLQFMLNVGLHYLTLDRRAGTLSGGEGQRIRLASQIGSGLMGVLYILDEPSIGLHAKDNEALIGTLERLRDMGNTVLVVEHDEETMQRADYILDLGPGAGVQGGDLVAAGTPKQIIRSRKSQTGRFLSGKEVISAPNDERRVSDKHLTLCGAELNNLQNVSVRIPLGTLTTVTGVSGSGKSSLVTGTLYPALAKRLNGSAVTAGKHKKIEGLEHVDKIIHITQDAIGRTPRSNPATYAGVFDAIRDVFALVPEAKKRGYKKGRFSFNVKGGRCEACGGYGSIQIEMHFLADVWVTCKECTGHRYNRETMQVRYKGKTISDVLNMDVQEALTFFEHHPKIHRIMQTLHDVGLDYIKLGQSALTFSGGEAQRIKLAKELSKRSTGKTVYILDEPTTGLHFSDVQKLLEVLHRLVDQGNTVIVIEHNMDVIKTADYLIDMGPEGGDGGGQVIAMGTPEDVMAVRESYTGEFLKKTLEPLREKSAA